MGKFKKFVQCWLVRVKWGISDLGCLSLKAMFSICHSTSANFNKVYLILIN